MTINQTHITMINMTNTTEIMIMPINIKINTSSNKHNSINTLIQPNNIKFSHIMPSLIK